MWEPIATVQRARRLRRDMSLPEVLLWRELRRGRPPTPKFRRQQPFGPYILDFYCDAARLCVEVDGSQHGGPEAEAADRSRDEYLRDRGVHTVRVHAWRVLDDPVHVANRMLAWAAFLSRRRLRQSGPPPTGERDHAPPGGGSSNPEAPR